MPDHRISRLVFVYNADSGLFNALADWAHKILSPQTYACRLCAVTYDNFGMRREWKQFVQSLGVPVEFLHRDELRRKYGVTDVPLPAVLAPDDLGLRVWLDADAVNACRTSHQLMDSIRTRLAEDTSSQ